MTTLTEITPSIAPSSEQPYKISRTAGGLSYRDITTPYVQWLSFANAGMLNRGNLWCFDYAMRHLPSDAPMVEIGSFCGLSTNLISYYRQKHGRANPLFTCDKWEFEGTGGPLVEDTTITHAEYREFCRETFLRNVRMFSRDALPQTIEALSEEFFFMWRRNVRVVDVFGREARLGGPISFAYIDGNHSYEFSRGDFENVDEFLESGGFILFDDSADGSAWEANRVCREVAEEGRYEVVIANPNYLFRKW
jgi:hypothetical protein